MKNIAVKIITSAITGFSLAIAVAVTGLIAKGFWYAFSFGWNLV